MEVRRNRVSNVTRERDAANRSGDSLHEKLVKKNSTYGSLVEKNQGSSPSSRLIIIILFVNPKANNANLVAVYTILATEASPFQH